MSAREGAELADLAARWTPRLDALARRIGDAVRAHRDHALASGGADALSRIAAQGAGDVTYGIDVPAEEALAAWLEEVAREEPISLLGEETGWRHLAPDGRGGTRELRGDEAFAHGGVAVVVDPIDGTRNLMTDLRSAWTAIALVPPSALRPSSGATARAPRRRDVVLGLVMEIPDSRSRVVRTLTAVRGGGCTLRTEEGDASTTRRLDAGSDARADHGYFPFFKYMADQRPDIAAVEARFFERLARHEAADVRNCYDDQYISNAGQLVLLSLGTYRMIADLRALLAERRGRPTLTGKPYDVAAAIVCAEEAGAIVTAADGSALDFPLDATTPVGFVGFANAATRARLEPHLRAVLAETTAR